MRKGKENYELIISSYYWKGKDQWGDWEKIEHTIGKRSCNELSTKTSYTKHKMKMKVDKHPWYEIGSDRYHCEKGEIDVVWYWDKKIPFNFKHYDKKVFNSDTLFYDWNIMMNGGVYGCIEDLKEDKNGKIIDTWGCWY